MTALLGIEVIPCFDLFAKRVGALGAQVRQSSFKTPAGVFETSAAELSRPEIAAVSDHPGRQGSRDWGRVVWEKPAFPGSPHIVSRSTRAGKATHTPRAGQKSGAGSSGPFIPDARCLQTLGPFFGAAHV